MIGRLLVAVALLGSLAGLAGVASVLEADWQRAVEVGIPVVVREAQPAEDVLVEGLTSVEVDLPEWLRPPEDLAWDAVGYHVLEVNGRGRAVSATWSTTRPPDDALTLRDGPRSPLVQTRYTVDSDRVDAVSHLVVRVRPDGSLYLIGLAAGDGALLTGTRSAW